MPEQYTIVISCVTTETVMVSSPVIHFQANEVHLFRYIRDPGTDKARLYEDHYMETCRQISETLPDCKIIEVTSELPTPLPNFFLNSSRILSDMELSSTSDRNDKTSFW